MQRLFVILLVGAAVAWLPTGAMASNQEVATQIAANLKDSGQLEGYQVGVRYQNGTTWLYGQVATQDQMTAALQLVFQTEGVTRIINELTIASPGSPVAAAPAASRVAETGSLRQATGAMGPEQLPRSTPSEFGVTRSRQAEMVQQPAPPQRYRSTTPTLPPAPAARVATTFTQQPVLPVNATAPREPTLAPPQIDTTVSMAQPAPVLRDMPVTMAMPVSQTVVQQVPHSTLQPIPDGTPMTPAYAPSQGQPLPVAYTQGGPMPMGATGMVQHVAPLGRAPTQARYDQPHLPRNAWPSYAAYPNYAAVAYPRQHSACDWPYIGPFYPYPKVPLGWRKVTMEWHDGCWQLDFDDGTTKGPFSGLFRPHH